MQFKSAVAPIANISDLRANIAWRFDEIEADRSALVVTREKHEPVVVLPLAELEGPRESLHRRIALEQQFVDRVSGTGEAQALEVAVCRLHHGPE